MSFSITCLKRVIHLLNYFILYPPSALFQLEQLSELQLCFLVVSIRYVVITANAVPCCFLFIFSIVIYLSLSGIQSGCICNASIALLEFEKVALMLCKLALHFCYCCCFTFGQYY